MRSLPLLVVVALSACGPAPAAGPHFPIEFYVSAGLNDELSAFQVSLVKNGSALDCVTVQKSCVKEQVAADRFVPLKGTDGQTHQSLSFSLDLMGSGPSSQEFALTDLPLGKDFALVVEAVSKDSPPQLKGSACNYLKELTAGDNAAVFAQIETLTPPVACDPRH